MAYLRLRGYSELQLNWHARINERLGMLQFSVQSKIGESRVGYGRNVDRNTVKLRSGRIQIKRLRARHGSEECVRATKRARIRNQETCFYTLAQSGMKLGHT